MGDKSLARNFTKKLITLGSGEATPKYGDQVIYHYTIRDKYGEVIKSTRSGGTSCVIATCYSVGVPSRHVLCHSNMLLGLLKGVTTMKKGEVSMFKMRSGMLFGNDSPVSVSDTSTRNVELLFDIEMIDFFKVEVISEDLGVLKKVIDKRCGWIVPSELCEVKVWITAKGGDGILMLSRTKGEPFSFILGYSEVPRGLEMGIGTMSCGEKAVIYVNREYLNQCSFMPTIEGIEEVQFEVEVVHFELTTDPDFYHNLRMLKPPDGTNITSDVATWEEYGTLMWDNSVVGSIADLMVQNSIINVLTSTLEVVQSSRIIEICLGILGNLASHDNLRDLVASETGLVKHVLLVLSSGDVKSLKQALRLWSLCLKSTAWVGWVTEIVPKPIITQIFSIAEHTDNPQLIEQVADFLLVVSERDVKYLVLPDLIMMGLPRVLLQVLTFWINKILDVEEPDNYTYHVTGACVRILQTLRVLSLLYKHSRDDSYSRELFQLLTSLINSPNKYEVGECCVTAATIIADMIKDAPILWMKDSDVNLFFKGLVDVFPYAWEDDACRISLWKLIRILIETSPFEMLNVLLHRIESIVEELNVRQFGATDDEERDIICGVLDTIVSLIECPSWNNRCFLHTRPWSCIFRAYKHFSGSEFAKSASDMLLPIRLFRKQDRAFDAEPFATYCRYISSLIFPGSENLRGDEADNSIQFKNALGINDQDAASLHMEVGRRIFRRNMETTDRDGEFELYRAFEKLVYVSTVVFGKVSSFILPWSRVFKVTDTQVEVAVRINAQRLYASSLSSLGIDIDVEELIRLRERQIYYEVSDELSEELLRNHMRELVKENISAALVTLKSRTRALHMRQPIEELDKILSFHSLLITLEKHPYASNFAQVLGTVSLLDGEYNVEMDDLELLYRTYVKDSLSSGRMEEDKLAALNQLRNILGLGKREAESITADITSKVYRERLAQFITAGEFETSESKAVFLQNLCEQLHFDAQKAAEIHAENYREELSQALSNGALTDKDVKLLEWTRIMLCIPRETVEAIHADVCSSIFVKVVMDAIASEVDGSDADNQHNSSANDIAKI